TLLDPSGALISPHNYPAPTHTYTLSLHDALPISILNAAKEVKLEGKVKIVGFDEDLETLKGIDDGYIYGTVVQNPYEFGKRSVRSEEHTSELQSLAYLVCRLLLEKKKKHDIKTNQ